MAWHKACAFYGTANGEGQQHSGTVVVDVRDPSAPRVTQRLVEPRCSTRGSR